MFDELCKLINSVGFPIGISIYLLVRFERKIDILTKSISDLSKIIACFMENSNKAH